MWLQILLNNKMKLLKNHKMALAWISASRYYNATNMSQIPHTPQ
jgi:hypothetical protein